MGKPLSFFSRSGATWVIDGQPLRNFASSSYLGLERHPDVIAGGRDARAQFGASFPISRAYLECPLYTALEDTLGQAMNAHVLITPSTTVAHLAALPVLVGDRDLVLVDQFAHAGVHMGTDLITGVRTELIQHNRVDLLGQRLREVGERYDRVWYVCDGVYSMDGNVAPFAELSALLLRFPKLHLYVDDAHGMSWTGRQGRGAALGRLTPLDRVIVAVSLSKAFGAAGGALALPTAELRDRVRQCGGPMIVSGPIVPSALGAALASAKLHLRPELGEMQAELMEHIAVANDCMAAAGLAVATYEETPVRTLHYDSVPAAQAVVRAMRERGFFTSISTFPTVAATTASVRFTISLQNSLADIRELVDNLAETAGRHLSELRVSSQAHAVN